MSEYDERENKIDESNNNDYNNTIKKYNINNFSNNLVSTINTIKKIYLIIIIFLMIGINLIIILLANKILSITKIALFVYYFIVLIRIIFANSSII